ncbi:MAG: hypothetical protein MZV70_22320 [Desulfobacterales bacterium]|nr:hypothetical protein [Desulfobacterales bacterium]
MATIAMVMILPGSNSMRRSLLGVGIGRVRSDQPPYGGKPDRPARSRGSIYHAGRQMKN